MNVNAYVTDFSDFRQNSIAFRNVDKLMIRSGTVLIRCESASDSAARFQQEDQLLSGSTTQVYAIPSGIIADLHCDEVRRLLPAPASVATEIDPDKEVAGPGSGKEELLTENMSQALKKLLRDNILDTRAYNVLTEIASDQKIKNVKQFFEQNSKQELMNYEGCGDGTIKKIKEIGKIYNLTLREN